MARLHCIAVICIIAFSITFLEVRCMNDELPKENPILQQALIKLFAGNGGLPASLNRGLMSGNTPPPMLRAMLNRFMSQRNTFQSDPFTTMLQQMIIFRIVGAGVRKQIIEGLKDRVKSDKVYTFHVELGWDTALQYLSEDGEMKGFTFSLIDAVCEEAKKNCEYIYNSGTNCYISGEGELSRAGPGILGRSVDVCADWTKSSERTMALAFTKMHWKEDLSSHFFVKSGNPKNFDPTDISTSTIGFIDGWICDLGCLLSATDLGPPSSIVYISHVAGLFDALENEEIDAVFIYAYFKDQDAGKLAEPIGDLMVCNDGTVHMMTRKDSDLIEWWDESLTRLMESGKYWGLCNAARREHESKGEIKCVTDQE